MKNSKKFLVLLLSLVLVCSMVFGLTACNNGPEDNSYVTIVLRDAINNKQQSVEVNVTGKGTDYTVGDLLLDATKEDLGFKVLKYSYTDDFKVFVEKLQANDLTIENDNANQNYVMFYSTSKDEAANPEQDFKVDNENYYQTKNGVSSTKVKAGAKYMFNLEHSEWNQYVTVILRDAATEKQETVKVKITGKGADYTVGDLLYDATKEDLGFKVLQYSYTDKDKTRVGSLQANELIVTDDPASKNFLMFYSSVASDGYSPDPNFTIGDVDFYGSANGVALVKVKADATYMFNVENHPDW